MKDDALIQMPLVPIYIIRTCVHYFNTLCLLTDIWIICGSYVDRVVHVLVLEFEGMLLPTKYIDVLFELCLCLRFVFVK